MNFFKKTTAHEQLLVDLEQAKHMLLAYEHQANYYHKLATSYKESIKRLQDYIENGIS